MQSHVVGAILAGGLSRRFDYRDKFFLNYEGKPLIQHVIESAKPQVQDVVICANGDLQRFASLSLPIVSDKVGDYGGPLAGIITAMQWCDDTHSSAEWIASFPADAISSPEDWVLRCVSQAQSNGCQAVYSQVDERRHYIYAVWSRRLLPFLQEEFKTGKRSLKSVLNQLGHHAVRFPHGTRFDNINTPGQWRELSLKGV